MKKISILERKIDAAITSFKLVPQGKPGEVDHPLYHVRDGVVIIPKNGVIPHGTVI
jgi:hypothetical protein